MTEGFDVGMEMSGNERAFNQMLEAMNHGGKVAVLGIPPGDVMVEMNEVIFKGLTVKGIYGRRIFETWYKSAAMLQSGLHIAPVVTHRFDVRRLRAGLRGDRVRRMRQGGIGMVKAPPQRIPQSAI